LRRARHPGLPRCPARAARRAQRPDCRPVRAASSHHPDREAVVERARADRGTHGPARAFRTRGSLGTYGNPISMRPHFLLSLTATAALLFSLAGCSDEPAPAAEPPKQPPGVVKPEETLQKTLKVAPV